MLSLRTRESIIFLSPDREIAAGPSFATESSGDLALPSGHTKRAERNIPRVDAV